jgi:hypothetical protein
VDPSAEDNAAIRVASEEGHTEIVRLLLQDPRVDPSADAIKIASANGYEDIVQLLKTRLSYWQRFTSWLEGYLGY